MLQCAGTHPFCVHCFAEYTKMSLPHADGVYTTLSKRLAFGNIYTYISNVVISVNPYKQLPVYGAEVIAKYTGAGYFQNEV